MSTFTVYVSDETEVDVEADRATIDVSGLKFFNEDEELVGHFVQYFGFVKQED